VNDFLEIGYWRQRDAHVEHVLARAEELLARPRDDARELELRLAAAVAELRDFDAESCPWRRRLAAAG
jgi:hypothetical protein